MNQKELNEIRRRFKLDRNSISKIFGCYVNSNKEIISWIDASMGLMQQEEQEMYLGLLKKALSGALGKNLVDIVFSTQQVADSDEHRLLQTMRQTELKDPGRRYLRRSPQEQGRRVSGGRWGHGLPLFRLRRLPGEGSHAGTAV